MSRHDDTMAVQDLRQDFLAIIREHAGHRILQAFAAGGTYIIGAAPEIHLLTPPFADGIILIHAAQDAVIALVQGAITNDFKTWHGGFRQYQLQGVLGTDEI